MIFSKLNFHSPRLFNSREPSLLHLCDILYAFSENILEIVSENLLLKIQYSILF